MEYEFNYRLSKKAEEDLDNIISYIAVELSNKKAATDFIKKLQNSIEQVCLFPESGAPVNNDLIFDIDIRKKIIGNYIMYYLPDLSKKTIYIVRIVYSKKNMDEILQQLNI